MANFNAQRAIDLLISGEEAAILDFASRQRSLREAEEKRIQDEEMEMALKMSMGVDEVPLDTPVDDSKLMEIQIVDYA